MFRTLVVPLDGSALAEQALPYAVRLAQANDGRIVLTRAAIAPMPASIEGANWEKDQLGAMADAERYLAKVRKQIGSQALVETSVSYGLAAPRILEHIQQESADAVVMATHGRTGLQHLLLGSVAESVLARSPVPVFLVHARAEVQPTAAFDPLAARLIVPLDGSTFAETALEPAIHFLGPAGELVLVLISRPPDHVVMDAGRRLVVAYIDQIEEAHTREAREYLEGVAKKLRATYPGMHVSTDARVAEDAASGIVRTAAERTADLVVMATHGRTGVLRAVVGSVAGEVLRTGGTPLLLVGPGTSGAPAVTPLHVAVAV